MFKDLLKEHIGYVVAINPIEPEKLESCGLKSVGSEYFSVVTQKGLLVHVPYSKVLSVIENNEGGGVNIKASMFGNKKVRLVIYVEHMIIYKGATGFGFQLPF